MTTLSQPDPETNGNTHPWAKAAREEARVHRPENRVDQLAAGVAALTNSEEWRRFLRVQSRFHRYSFNNAVLIAAQFPEATQVAGFAAWKKLGRHVRRGEKAIWILAPMVVKGRSDDSSRPTPGSSGSDGPDRPRIRGFRYVAVFDITQTEGAELPAVCQPLLGNDDGENFPRLVAVASELGYRTELAELPGGINGDCSFVNRLLRVEVRNAPAQQVKTLAHELAHALMHEEMKDRSQAELEAESVAFVVGQHLGIDTGAYTFGYVAVWGGGPAALEALRQSGSRIQRTARLILDLLDAGEAEPFGCGRVRAA